LIAMGRRTFLLRVGLLLSGRSGAATVDETALGEAVGVLAKEKSAAEQYAVVLTTVGKKHIETYLRGVTLYADAQAHFDGLIEQLRFCLRDGYNPTKSNKFTTALKSAAEKRIAFTKFVSSDVIGKIEGKKPGLRDVIPAVPELIKAISDAGLSIWTAFRGAGKEKRDAILADLDRLWEPDISRGSSRWTYRGHSMVVIRLISTNSSNRGLRIAVQRRR